MDVDETRATSVSGGVMTAVSASCFDAVPCSGCGTHLPRGELLVWPDGVASAICRICQTVVLVSPGGGAEPLYMPTNDWLFPRER